MYIYTYIIRTRRQARGLLENQPAGAANFLRSIYNAARPGSAQTRTSLSAKSGPLV